MAKRSLSQNFLIDQNIIDKIIRASMLCKEDSVLEIGPGQGALTKKIVAITQNFIAVETDSTLLPLLEGIRTIIHADFLQFDLSILKNVCKVISNLPYHITSKILKKLVLHKPFFSTWTLMMQKEVAMKLLDPLSTPLIYFLNYHYEIKIAFHVSPNAFYPRPSVDSTVVNFFPNNKALDPLFFDFLNHAFEHRRKLLLKNLTPYYSQILKCFKKLQIKESSRIDELTPKQIEDLFLCHSLYSTSTSNTPKAD
jgi:16S rRNA (adenine1518-N6/adenine1519-N6)-dimethyltransferase